MLFETAAALAAIWGDANSDRRKAWRASLAKVRTLLSKRGASFPPWYGAEWQAYTDMFKVNNEAVRIRNVVKAYAQQQGLPLPAGWDTNIAKFEGWVNQHLVVTSAPTAPTVDDTTDPNADIKALIAQAQADAAAAGQRQALLDELARLQAFGKVTPQSPTGYGEEDGFTSQATAPYAEAPGGQLAINLRGTGISVEAWEKARVESVRAEAAAIQAAMDAIDESGTLVKYDPATSGKLDSIKELDLATGVVSSIRFEGPASEVAFLSIGAPSYDGESDITALPTPSTTDFNRTLLKGGSAVDLDENGKAIHGIDGRTLGDAWAYLGSGAGVTAYVCKYPSQEARRRAQVDLNGHPVKG